MGYTYDEAYALTNPADDDATRQKAAVAIQAGTAANEVYWNHTDDLTALKAAAAGHGQVIPAESEADPSAVSGGAASPAIGDGKTATEEETVTDAEVVPEGEPASAEPEPSGPVVDANANPTAAVAALRKQLQDAGLTPSA